MARHGDRSVDGWGLGPWSLASRLPSPSDWVSPRSALVQEPLLRLRRLCSTASRRAWCRRLRALTLRRLRSTTRSKRRTPAPPTAVRSVRTGALDDPHRGFVRCLAPRSVTLAGFRPLRSLLRRRQRTPALPTRPRPRGLRRRWRSAHPSSRTARSVGWRRCFTAPPPISPVASPTTVD